MSDYPLFEDVSVIQTIARHHIYKDILRPPLEKHSRVNKNPTMTKIVLLWLLSKMILNDSYYHWTCASNYFSTVQFVFEERTQYFVCCNWSSSVFKRSEKATP